jgi:hypothetical protein
MKHGGWRLAAVIAAFCSASPLIGCQPEARPQLLPKREPYIALERDFQDFERWTKIDLSQRPAVGETHAEGEAHEYVNQLPPRGAQAFPVGTILVKSVSRSAKEQDVLAMVKRGGGYNRDGAPGWEWFELRRRPDETLAIVWRGMSPPSGEGYGGDPMGGCNGCHQMATKNDFVLARALALSDI